MSKLSIYNAFKSLFTIITLLILSVQTTWAISISQDDIQETCDFNKGTITYTISSTNIPEGSHCLWKVDKEQATGFTLTLPLSNRTRKATVTVTPADGEPQALEFSIEPKSYGTDYANQHFYADQFASGDGSKDNPYLISNDMELALLAHSVNSGSSEQMLSGTYFKLSDDINLSRGIWTPIGTWNVNSKDSKTRRFFAGKFEGDGHVISNMQIEWINESNNEASWGLFSRLYGKSSNESEYATVTNLMIENACVEKKKDYIPTAGTVKIGVLAGDLTDNAEISNIIIHNSKVTDNGETYTTAGKYRMGGIVGYLDGKRYKIYNIAANTEMNMLKNARINNDVTISAGIGCASSFRTDNAILPTNIYVYGPAIVTSSSSRVRKGGVVAMYSSGYKLTADQQKTLYYSPELIQAGSNIDNYGSQQDIASFGLTFATQCNDYISDKKIDKKMWSYFSNNERFSFSSVMLKLERGSSDVLKAVDKAGNISTESYDWYVSYDNINWEKQNAEPCSSYTLPRKDYNQYVYAILSDSTLRTSTTMVKSIQVSAIIDSKTKPGTFIIHVSNDTEISNNALGLTVSYEWYKGTELLTGEKDSTYTRPSTAKETDQYNCHVTVKSDDLILFDKWFSTTTVVYLKPTDTTNISEKERMANEDWGYSPGKPMLTWKGAYSKLSPYASWSENYIVLIGESSDSITNDKDEGFNITQNYQTENSSNLTSDNWKNIVNSDSPLFRNATITGKWEGLEDNEGIIQISGANIGLPLWGDTRFQDITFKKGTKLYYSIIYCQYHNLEMGKGIKMIGFNQVLPGYGTIDGAVTNAFHIFGGFLNDARFYPLNSKENIENFEKSMPHGRNGFKITVKSGFYSCICAGGRQISNNTGNDIVTIQNGVMGTPNMPVKCTIDIDIDSVWNNANNEERTLEKSGSLNGQTRKNDYDVGIVLAGNHEGAMYADVDINIRSGRVARAVNGTLGSQHDLWLTYPNDNGKKYRVPDNTFMGRANITVDPASSENYTSDDDVDSRVVITELYGGSTGRGQLSKSTVNNPFYGYSTITINGGTFKILPEDNKQRSIIFSGIYGAGAGGMNGIGYGDDNDNTHTPDQSIPYWNNDKTVMLYGPYADAKDKLIKYHCYNANDNTYTDVDPTETNTKIVINGGKFGFPNESIDGIYAGGSGYMSQGLWTNKETTPNVCGGNVYGKQGETVSSLIINGGEFYCKNGVFAGGRGTDYYYTIDPYAGNAADYTDLGKTYGNVELNITGGIFHCSVYGGGYGVADAKLKQKNSTTSTISTLSHMARVYGQSKVQIHGGTFYQNIYGGGDMAVTEYHGSDPATYVIVSDSAEIRGAVFAGGNGRPYRLASSTTINDDTQLPDSVGRVIGSTCVSFYGSTELAPYIYGNIYGGGNLAKVEGDTRVNLYAGHFAGQIFGGGNGLLNSDKSVRNSADVLGNTFIILAEDQGNQEDNDSGNKVDNFSINVIWDKMWDADNSQFYVWDTDAKNRNVEGWSATEPIIIDKSKFFDDTKEIFINPHNIYGGGNIACNVGTYTALTSKGDSTIYTLTEGTGNATVIVQKGMTPYELLKTSEWKLSYSDNDNPHFSVFGGGYGPDTKVGSTDVTVDVEGDYSIYDSEIDDSNMQLAPSLDKSSHKAGSTTIPVFDNSKGIPNFTILGVLGGGYSGTIVGNTKVTVDGQTFIHRVYGGGFGNPESITDNTTGEIGGNTEVCVKGAHIYGDVFGGGAGVAPETASGTHFMQVARVIGTTKVEVSDDALIYGNVYGGGDIANVGIYQTTKSDGYYDQSKLSSVSTLDQDPSSPNAGSLINYKAFGYKAFVNIIGGDIFGQVFGGGRGLKKSQAVEYYKLGRINGNTLVHVANTERNFDSYIINNDGDAIPHIWNRIYGGCNYGTVDGNTLVHIEGGMLGLNIFGGGFGDVAIDDAQLIEKDKDGINSGASTSTEILNLVLGKKDIKDMNTYANVLGNTKVQIDGGSWIWNRKADINGNITTWLASESGNEKVCEDYNEFRKMMLAVNNVEQTDEAIQSKVLAIFNKIRNDNSTKEFFDIDSYTFKKNHNIFGGGNRACYVGTYTDNDASNPLKGSVLSGTGDAVVEINHSPLTDITDTKGKAVSLLDCTTLQGFCWIMGNNNVSHPQFSIFGAGYGANTKVGTSKVYVQPGAKTETEGGSAIEIAGKRYRYLNQQNDMKVYNTFENQYYDDFQKISKEDKRLYYGSTDGTDSDPKTYLRYRASRWAWALGMPNFTFMEIHGGGFSGYVLGDTYVETDCELSCHNIYGAGLGAKPYSLTTEDTDYNFGSIGGNAKVFMKAGNIANNVYGGGAGVESILSSENKLIDFPDMARVNGKTEVHVYGEKINGENAQVERTQIFGSVYGGGDVANVGTVEANPVEFTHKDVYEGNNIKRTSLVNIRGGIVYSRVFTGGKGRSKAACADYTQLGGIYGNACLIIDRPTINYPYCDLATGKSYNPSSDGNLKHPTNDINASVKPYIWNRIYGGCENGTIYGNTLVAVNDGYIGNNIFGGGWGNCDTVYVNQVAIMDTTFANVTGNTNMIITGGDALLTSYWLINKRFWEPTSIIGEKTYSPQYDPEARKFKINHNIYAGGNTACIIGKKDDNGNLNGSGNTYLTMVKGLLHDSTQVISGVTDANKSFFEYDEWKEIYEKVGSPHFCIFGAGYGENTNILGNTNINIAMSNASINDLGMKEGEEYKHFVSGCSVMDIVGGGYSGKVEGNTYIKGTGGIFCRRVFGGGFYNTVNNTNVNIQSIDCHDIFGGGLMGDVLKSTTINIGQKSTDNTNNSIYIHGDIYGGNDVSGYVNVRLNEQGYFSDNGGTGTHINIYGGHVYGNVYGAGNGNYLYALDKKGNTKVTVNEHYPLNPDDPESETEPLVYTVPMRETMPSYKAASDAAKIVNINSWRPLTNKVTINIKGNTTEDGVVINGDVYGGGNSATVQKVQDDNVKTNITTGAVNLNIGNHVNIGRVFMGCNGDALFTASEDNNFMNKFQKLNGDIEDYSKELNLADTIDWINDPSNRGISTLYLSTENEERPLVYPHLLDLYFQPVETDIQGSLTWNGCEDGEGLTDCTIGTFCCGGNRGNMNVYPLTIDNYTTNTPKANMKIGNVLEYTFPEGLTITDKIIGGCNNANYNYKGKVFHEGGYLLGMAHSLYPFIKLNIKNKFQPKEKEGAYVGGNVYGGCYQTGTVRGDITIDFQSDMLEGKSKEKLEKSNELLANNAEFSTLNVYGAGYGMESYVYGNTDIKVAENIACKTPTTTLSTSATDGTATYSHTFNATGTSANFIYGGGQQGNVIGVTNVEVFNGHIFKAITGGSYSGYVWGSTQVKVGYPKYYQVGDKQSGVYLLNRADQNNKYIDRIGNVETGDTLPNLASETIKQSIHLITGEIISQAVYDAIVGRQDITDFVKEDYFTPYVPSPKAPLTWDDINIQIGEAIYGGGYSVAQGTSVLANNTTVLKYTDTYNLYDAFANNNEYLEELQRLPNSTTVGFGGNTTILVGDATTQQGDATDRDHITISHQEMKAISLPDGTDLFGYYYKHKDGNYRYISFQDKYFFGSGYAKPEQQDPTDTNIYEYDSEGGIFGDGHQSYAQGMRCADLTGYGFASFTISNPKIINTFQRLDILRLEDNCLTVLGARDYATNKTDKTPYSMARIGEIQMFANNIAFADNQLQDKSVKRARNYLGLANNIHYVGAVVSDVPFNDASKEPWHDDTGAIPSTGDFTNKSYQQVKQSYIDAYYSEDSAEKGNVSNFQKRNDGTAKNMIGIASGYALKIQNAQEFKDSVSQMITDSIYYGPVYGVIEMNLIDVRADEGGGYVYADNVHKRTVAEGVTAHAVDFLETTGNFVFPYSEKEGHFIVDDCFPTGYNHLTGNDPDKEIDIHYWYVTGFNYYYNAHITGYTYKNASKFYNDNSDGLTVLSGLKAGQPVTILSMKMRSGHPIDKSDYACDLEYRNYLPKGTANNADKDNKDVSGKYKLFIGASSSPTYVDPSSSSINDNEKGFAALLPMNSSGTYDSKNYIQQKLPTSLKDDAKISFLLSDSVNNETSLYFNKHLAEKCLATIILKAPAYESYTNETDNKPIISNVSASDFFVANDKGGYTQIENGKALSTDVTYYIKNGISEEYTPINPDSIFKKTQEGYCKIDLTKVIAGNTYYCAVPRWYTYTIYLTIEYVQGPDIEGHITVDNCALPGEMIRIKKDKVVIKADESFSANGYYWRIGKREQTADGKWEFTDKTDWTATSIASGYDTYKQGNSERNGMFKGCNYDKTNDYLDIPAYYFMNGYGIQLGITMNGLDRIFPVDMQKDDQFVVHNYHRMDPHQEGINLHLAEAIARIQAEKETAAANSSTTNADNLLAEPRIYIADQRDLTAFIHFVDTIGTNSHAPRYGACAQFILQKDLSFPDEYTANNIIFKGILHGNGHVLRGLAEGNAFLTENQGHIYNLGMKSGMIATNGCTNGGAYHCCFELLPTTNNSDNPIVYHMDGTSDKHYTKDDFRFGRVAYDLNEYYLRTRFSNSTKEDTLTLKYVYDYYANGDYQYAQQTDSITSKITGITYLRTGPIDSEPNYEQAETRHNKAHTIDKARAQDYIAATDSTTASRSGAYVPLFNEKGNDNEPMNDFIYWGQLLQSVPADYPTAISSHQVGYMTNRIYRTAGYYGDAQLNTFHYNAFYQGSSNVRTYVHNPATTAIDFTCQHDLEKAKGMTGSGIYYPPVNDNASIFYDFNVKDDVTRNLLIYTADNNEDDNTEAYDAVNKLLAYNETTKETLIKGHHIVGNNDTEFSTSLLHLVERDTNDMNSEDESCKNNNFCVPIPFSVTKHAWYVRKPKYYAASNAGAWEGICLPFTVEKAVASLNGEITHFYGIPTAEEQANPATNVHTLHHEYWLRGLVSVRQDSAVFLRPNSTDASTDTLFIPTNDKGTNIAEDVTYTFDNPFFINTYEDWLYNKDANPYYANVWEYKNYPLLTAGVPYIVRFPGERYYEFDLSNKFYNNLFNKTENPQTIAFHAYGRDSDNETLHSAISIPATTTMTTAVNGYHHQGTFMAKDVVKGNIYGMNDNGTAFSDASAASIIRPFRTYITLETTKAARHSIDKTIIYIAETMGIDQMTPEVIRQDDNPVSDDNMTIRAIGEQRVRIESTVATKLYVYVPTGQLYRILDVQPGTATYSGFRSGIYLFGKTKLTVR